MALTLDDKQLFRSLCDYHFHDRKFLSVCLLVMLERTSGMMDNIMKAMNILRQEGEVVCIRERLQSIDEDMALIYDTSKEAYERFQAKLNTIL